MKRRGIMKTLGIVMDSRGGVDFGFFNIFLH